jgi:GrpB-like predicted nucleotidyltransferase (UPF0157 family)
MAASVFPGPHRRETIVPVVVASYRTDWPGRAAALAATLRDRLGPLAERVEHIGSTSIPGMAALLP